MKYKIALVKSDEGYSVSVPGLPGCWSQGETEEEALSGLKEALELHFEPPQATRPPLLRTIEMEVGAA